MHSLTGPLPAFDAVNFPSLSVFNAANNSFSGSFPASVTALPSLYYANFALNRLTGPVPTAFASPYLLVPTALFATLFPGSPHPPLCLYWLQNLDFSYNQMTGFPAPLLQSTVLLRLVLASNQLTYNFPPNTPCTAQNSSLMTLDLSHNSISGELLDVMDCVAQWLPALSELNLAGNQIYTNDGRVRRV
jgi:hypothetical protein